MRKLFVLLSVVALATGCNNGDSVTGPDYVPDSSTTVPNEGASNVSSEPTVPAPGDPPGPAITVTGGVVTINNLTNHSIERNICYFENVGDPQPLLAQVDAPLAAGQVGVYNLPEEICGVSLQIDVVRNGCKDSGDLGFIDAFEFFTAPECNEECVPGQWEVIEDTGEVWGEWGECPSRSTVQICTETVTECREGSQTITESNGCETRTRIIDLSDTREVEREIPCPCEPEPEGEPIIEESTEWGEWGECGAGQGPTASTRTPACYQTRTGIKTITTTQNMTCDEDPVITVETEEVSESRPCECQTFCPAELPAEDVYDQQGNEFAECAFFGPYTPVDKDEHLPFDMEDADFYLIKAGSYMRLVWEKPNPWGGFVFVDRWRAISHITACSCGVD